MKMASNSKTNPPGEQVQGSIRFDRTKKQTLYSKHKNAIRSTLAINNDLSDTLIFYCLDKMEREGKAITGSSLTQECLDSEATFPNHLDRNEDSKEDVTISELIAAESRRNEPVMSASRPAGASSTPTQTPVANGSNSSPSHRKKAKRRTQSSSTHPPNLQATSENASRPVFPSSSLTSLRPTRTNDVRNGADLDVVDGSTAGLFSFSPYEDQVDNIGRPALSSTLEPSPAHPQLDQHNVFKNGASGFDFSEMEPIKSKSDSRQNEELDGARTSDVKEWLHAVTKENQILEMTRMCTMCKVNPRGITFLPCGHFIACRECAGPVYVCAACNKNILATVETYLC